MMDNDELDRLYNKLRRNGLTFVGQIETIDTVGFTAEVLRKHNWDAKNDTERYWILRGMLVDLHRNQNYQYFEVRNEDGDDFDIDSVCNSTVEELFGPDAFTIWG